MAQVGHGFYEILRDGIVTHNSYLQMQYGSVRSGAACADPWQRSGLRFSDLTADTEHFSVFGHGLNQIPDILVLDHCIPPVDSCARESAFMVMPLRRLSVFVLLISLGIRPARCGYYSTGIGSRVVAKLTSKWKILTFEMQILRKYGQKRAYLKQNMNK